jgi:hypothetical protein
MLCAVLAFFLLHAVTITVQAQAPAPGTDTLTKPLTQYTVGDVFPKVAGDAFRETGKSWQSAASEFNKRAGDRRTALAAAIPAKETEIKNLKTQLKAAEKDKDFTKAGTLEGQIKTEEIVTAVLAQLSKLNEAQSATATAWGEAGTAMAKYVDADEKFDQYRTVGIARPEDGATGGKLSAEGYNTILAQATALSDMGTSFDKLGSALKSLADRRKALLDSLAKGGHIEKPK